MATGNFFEALINMMNQTELKFDEAKHMIETPLPDLVPRDLSGKVIIVTGGNVGVGFETAKALAGMNPRKLILACRNAEKAQAAVHAIEHATNFRGVEAWSLDLASFASVRAFAQKFVATGLPLDILVSNAGVGVGRDWVTTSDGYEVTLQVNHLANALLILLLHPALKSAAQAQGAREQHFPRVVVVSSDTHFWCSVPTADDPHPIKTLNTKPESPSPFGIYPATKLLNVLFAKGYAARCPDAVSIYSANPAYTESQLGAKDPLTGESRELKRHTLFKQRTTFEGAKTIIDCAISPEVGEGGGYYSEMHESRTVSSTVGETGKKFATHVWDDTIAILKQVVPENEVYSW